MKAIPSQMVDKNICNDLQKHILETIIEAQPLAITQAIKLGNYIYENALQEGNQWKWKGESVGDEIEQLRRKIKLLEILLKA